MSSLLNNTYEPDIDRLRDFYKVGVKVGNWHPDDNTDLGLRLGNRRYDSCKIFTRYIERLIGSILVVDPFKDDLIRDHVKAILTELVNKAWKFILPLELKWTLDNEWTGLDNYRFYSRIEVRGRVPGSDVKTINVEFEQLTDKLQEWAFSASRNNLM